jgi:hypothetical protein
MSVFARPVSAQQHFVPQRAWDDAAKLVMPRTRHGRGLSRPSTSWRELTKPWMLGTRPSMTQIFQTGALD